MYAMYPKGDIGIHFLKIRSSEDFGTQKLSNEAHRSVNQQVVFCLFKIGVFVVYGAIQLLRVGMLPHLLIILTISGSRPSEYADQK
jgi:hypothetical protein